MTLLEQQRERQRDGCVAHHVTALVGKTCASGQV
jgi:hypothetical protein